MSMINDYTIVQWDEKRLIRVLDENAEERYE